VGGREAAHLFLLASSPYFAGKGFCRAAVRSTCESCRRRSRSRRWSAPSSSPPRPQKNGRDGPAGTSCLGSPGHQILAPIRADGTRTFEAGNHVPAKFRVCDANGVSVDRQYPEWRQQHHVPAHLEV